MTMTFAYDERESTQLTAKNISDMCSLDAGYTETSPTAYTVPAATHMVYATMNGAVWGKLEYSFCTLNENDDDAGKVHVHWVRAFHCGRMLLQYLEWHMGSERVDCIEVVVSLDKNENSDTVKRRLNFWYQQQYVTKSLSFPRDNAVRLVMQKAVN